MIDIQEILALVEFGYLTHDDAQVILDSEDIA
jgi:hypothetical protein